MLDETVSPPDWEVVPITIVPAVMADRSEDATENVPPVPPTEMDLLPLGRSVTVPEPPLREPEKDTSLAVICICDADRDVEMALLTSPVPLVVIRITPLVLLALALRTIEPFEPEEVVRDKLLSADNALDVVILPLAVRESAPVDVISPEVLIFAEAPVVVNTRSSVIFDVAMATAPEFVIVETPAPELIEIFEAAVSIGPNIAPAALKLTVPEDKVEEPLLSWI